MDKFEERTIMVLTILNSILLGVLLLVLENEYVIHLDIWAQLSLIIILVLPPIFLWKQLLSYFSKISSTRTDVNNSRK